MQTRRLGNSDLDITVIGFGAWAIGGGDWLFGWGPQDDADSVKAIHRAVDLGINWIDTAAAYGLGHSEEVVARAVRELPPARRPHVFTKCSLVWDESRTLTHDLHPDSLRREVEGSLTRLGVDTIDLQQFHVWTDEWAGDERWQRAIDDLKRQRLIRAFGISLNR